MRTSIAQVAISRVSVIGVSIRVMTVGNEGEARAAGEIVGFEIKIVVLKQGDDASPGEALDAADVANARIEQMRERHG